MLTSLKQTLKYYLPQWCLPRYIMIKYFYKATLRLDFYRRMGYTLHLDQPCTFSEKIQWLKCYYHDPLLTQCVDKLSVRDYITQKIGSKYLIPLIAVYDAPDQIDFSHLPEEFVLKSNHASGQVLLCRNKKNFNKNEARRQMKIWMKTNYYYAYGEWAYKNIHPKLLCEKLLHGTLIDYKFFCFHGIPKFVNIIGDRISGEYKDGFYDLAFHRLPFQQSAPPIDFIQVPPHWEDMIRIARILSADFPFVRVDLYDLEGQVYFGELTFTPANGMDPFYPSNWDEKIGKYWNIHKIP